jgi:hypothetical protein
MKLASDTIAVRPTLLQNSVEENGSGVQVVETQGYTSTFNVMSGLWATSRMVVPVGQSTMDVPL